MNNKTVVENGVVQTLCAQCENHCGMNVSIKNGKMEKITGLKEHPQNRGRLCPKAVHSIDLCYHPDRLLKPLKRTDNGSFKEISYEQAMDEITEKVQQIKEKYGARSMGIWAGEGVGFLQQEEYARRFAHAFGTPNYLCAGSLCSCSTWSAYSLVQGPDSIGVKDFSNAGVILMWGANPSISYPPEWWRIQEGRRKGAKLVIIDPRRSESARKADLFVQLYPGTDGALAWGLCRQLIQSGTFDHDLVQNHSVGFEPFAEYAERFTPEYVAQQTGVNKETFEALTDLIVANQPQIINFPGIALEHQTNGFNAIRSIICLTGLCGALNTKGAEVLRKPCPHRSLLLYDDPTLTNELPAGVEKYPAPYEFFKMAHSMTAMDYMLGKEDYPLRGLILTAGNPVITSPNAAKVSEALSGLDLLVCKDIFLTPTARLAHYVLPAATFMERSDVFYYPHNQHVGLSTKVLDVPGARNEYSFWHDLAHRLGLGERYFPWADEDEVNRWILEPSGISLETLQAHPESVEYAPMEDPDSQSRSFSTRSGKFEFSSDHLKGLGYPALPEYVSPAYVVARDENYPFILITGARSSDFRHSRIVNIRKYRESPPKAECEIHPADASRLGIKDGDRVRVVSHIGAVEVPARLVPETDMLPGLLQIIHGLELGNVNLVTDDQDTDPISGFPNMKIVAVKLEKL